MRYSLNTNQLRKGMSPAEIIAFIKKCGFEGLEWGLGPLENIPTEIKAISTLAADSGLEVINWLSSGKPWKKDDMKKYAENIAALGGRSMRVAHPWIAYNLEESLHQEKSFNEIFKLAKDSMPFLAELSEATGVRFLFETHGGALLASPLAVKMLFDGMNPRHVGVIYDPANTLVEGGLRPRSEVEVMKDYIAYVHAKNVAFFFDGNISVTPLRRTIWARKTVPPSAGALDWIEVFFALKNGGFDGFVSVEEFFSPQSLHLVGEALAFLKDCERLSPAKPIAPFTVFND